MEFGNEIRALRDQLRGSELEEDALMSPSAVTVPRTSDPTTPHQSPLSPSYIVRDVTGGETPRAPYARSIHPRNTEHADSPSRRPSEERSRPSAVSDETFRDFTSAITDLLRRFTPAPRTPHLTRAFYQFGGTLEEDPYRFLLIMEEHCAANEIRAPQDILTVIRSQFTGSAKTWMDSYRNIHLSYEAFRSAFLARFDSPDEEAAANISFFADRQQPGETAEVFLARKRQLMERLQPNVRPESILGIVITLLTPTVGNILRSARPTSWDELTTLAANVERGIARTAPEPAPRDTYANRRRDAAAHNTHYETRAPVARVERAIAPAPTNARPYDRDNANRGQIATNGPHTPCRYCQAWHYHNQCPQNPFRGPQQTQNQGNWRTADGAPRRSAPPAGAHPIRNVEETHNTANRDHNRDPANRDHNRGPANRDPANRNYPNREPPRNAPPQPAPRN